MKSVGRVLLLLCVALSPVSTWAAKSGAQLLDDYVAALNTLRAEFSQVVTSSQLASSAPASGVLYIRKPGQFRWDYLEPYRQQIVSDGKQVWLYDEDLEQVTVRAFDQALQATPALLLSDGGRWRQTFEIDSEGKSDGGYRLRLKPRAQDASFHAVELMFVKTELASIKLIDSLGQETLIRLMGIERNLKLKDALFHFEVPPGVDVFQAEQ